MRLQLSIVCLAGLGGICPAQAQSQAQSQAQNQAQPNNNGLSAQVEVYGGQDVVPPDVIESGITQERIEGLIGAGAEVIYRIGDTRLTADAGAEVYPVDERYNRYSIGGRVAQDIPLSNDRRTRLRLGAGYQHVFGEDGRVFGRLRADSQLIHRHGASNTSVARLRYGRRNQSEERFTGFDQDEWLLELRHTWRPGGGPGSISASLLGLKHDAEEDRFSYDGYGFRVVGRMPLDDEWAVSGRLSVVQRDYKAPFSALFPEDRSDTHIRAVVGAERNIGSNLILFGEGGYVSNPSNIPVRDYNGVVATAGVRWLIK
ncbi:hypothetical protein [Altererythrobacter sp. ZODW24]|uniref:hypothetical protein n=1 Tax=Altererythrobacter sp. ZODW24 TaxID=2185142 RepID=UPI000DF86010|nr:hypothetical protein [Altererythrobacter sp. ZODW24]